MNTAAMPKASREKIDGSSGVNRPVMRYHGSKWRLAKWIMGFFPPHRTYVEPFGGAAGVLMQKARSHAEVYNDLDGDIVNVFRVLRDPQASSLLADLCAMTPYARAEFNLAYEPTDDPIEQARRTIFRAAAGFGSAGATKGRTGFRTHSVSNRNDLPADIWTRYPTLVGGFCRRLQGVLIENREAIDVITHFDGPDTLFFVDPPYVHESRSIRGGRYYAHEMDGQGHKTLLDALLCVDGAVVLSGYASDLYDQLLLPAGWQRSETTALASGRHGTVHRTECVWINPRCASLSRQQSLF